MVTAGEVLQVWHHEGEWQRITLNVERGDSMSLTWTKTIMRIKFNIEGGKRTLCIGSGVSLQLVVGPR